MPSLKDMFKLALFANFLSTFMFLACVRGALGLYPVALAPVARGVPEWFIAFITFIGLSFLLMVGMYGFTKVLESTDLI